MSEQQSRVSTENPLTEESKSSSASAGTKGIDALLKTPILSSERLPMLEVVFDRLVRMLSTSLRNFTSDNVEVEIIKMDSVRFGDYLEKVPSSMLISVFKAEEWDNHGILTIDSDLIYSVVDVLLGGRRNSVSVRVEGRAYTTIERTLMERLLRIILSDLSAAFDPVSTVTFRFDRLETNPKFAMIVRPNNISVLIHIKVGMEERGGSFYIILPHATLEPIRDLLLQMFMGEKFGRDSIWETHMAGELCETDIQVEAVLDQLNVSLTDVLNWQVGSKVLLNAGPKSSVILRCGNIKMFSGKMGRKGDSMSVKIDNVF